MDQFDYSITRQFSTQNGLYIAAIWTGSFFCWAYSMDYILLGPLSLVLGIGSVILLGMLLRNFSREMQALNFFRAAWMSWFTYLCAGLLTTLAQFLYFQFLDQGHLANVMEQAMLMPENEALMKQMLAAPEYQQVFQQMAPNQDVTAWSATDLAGFLADTLRSISAKDIAMEMLCINFILSIICTIPSTLIGILGSKRRTR